MTFLFRRAALLAAVEGTFRTDQVPQATANVVTPIDSTSDMDDPNDEFDIVGHGWVTGDGPVKHTLLTGAGAPAEMGTAEHYIIRMTDDIFAVATSLANAVAGTKLAISVVVGTFTLEDVQSDAFLVEEPEFAPDITVVERNNVRVTLSPEPLVTARKIATVTFAHETRGNGVIDGTLAPRVGVLLRGCGMSETLYGESGSETETILDDAAIHVNLPTGRFTYTKTEAYIGTLPRVVILECTTGGGSGVAIFDVFSPRIGNAASPLQAEIHLTNQSMTDATPFQLINDTPSADAEITPTITTSFVAGDTYVIQLAPTGHKYEPVSDSIESLSIYLHFGDSTGGLRHRMTGARGTFTVEGEANDFARYSFTFTGDWIAPDDQVLPSTPEYETTLPPSVELANMVALGGKDFDADDPDEVNLCASSFSIDLANEVVARTCINAPESVAGAVITGRAPTGAFNPEVVQEDAHPFWEILSDGDLVFWHLRVGKTQGNVTVFSAPEAQYSELAYGDRDGIRIYDVTTALRTNDADDELRIVIC